MDPLQILKECTAEAHRRLEAEGMLARLVSPDLSIDEYRLVLVRMLGYVEPMEEALSAAAADLRLDVERRRKAHLISADLRALGYDASSIRSIPRCTALPDISSVDAALGALYVMEGSTLGGRIICKRVGRSLDLDPESGAGYYHGYGTDTGVMWKELSNAIRSRLAGGGSVSAMAASADAVFESLRKWLTHCSYDRAETRLG